MLRKHPPYFPQEQINQLIKIQYQIRNALEERLKAPHNFWLNFILLKCLRNETLIQKEMLRPIFKIKLILNESAPFDNENFQNLKNIQENADFAQKALMHALGMFHPNKYTELKKEKYENENRPWQFEFAKEEKTDCAVGKFIFCDGSEIELRTWEYGPKLALAEEAFNNKMDELGVEQVQVDDVEMEQAQTAIRLGRLG